ncbi:hypothetical protein [Aliiruegeria lutimaris]|nr:hypothetical protein [Aliiruegeria lutimaris]
MLKSETEREVGYPFVRCAGLYFGYGEYGGAALGESIVMDLANSGTQYVSVAAILRKVKKSERGLPAQDINVHFEEAATNAKSISTLYADRMRQNYATVGEAWGSDQLIASDRAICDELGPVVQMIRQRAGFSG